MARVAEVGNRIDRGQFRIIGEPCHVNETEVREDGNEEPLSIRGRIEPGIIETCVHDEYFEDIYRRFVQVDVVATVGIIQVDDCANKIITGSQALRQVDVLIDIPAPARRDVADGLAAK